MCRCSQLVMSKSVRRYLPRFFSFSFHVWLLEYSQTHVWFNAVKMDESSASGEPMLADEGNKWEKSIQLITTRALQYNAVKCTDKNDGHGYYHSQPSLTLWTSYLVDSSQCILVRNLMDLRYRSHVRTRQETTLSRGQTLLIIFKHNWELLPFRHDKSITTSNG